MGKAARKMKKRQAQSEAAETKQENAQQEAVLREQMAAGEYAAAIDTISRLIKGNDIKPEFMYDAAYAYFMLDDYERAGQWVNNTLSYAPEHLSVRILLARLLMLQNREDDAWAVLAFVIERGGDSLTEAQRKEIEEAALLCEAGDREKVRQSYPHVATFLHWDAPAADTKDVSQILARLREKVAAAGAAAGEVVEEAAAAVKPMAAAGVAAMEGAVAAAKPAFEAGAAAVAKKPADILASLKERLAAVGEGKAEEPSETGPAEKAQGDASLAMAAAEKTKQEVLEKALTAVQKAELLTSFAGGYYMKGALGAAELLLQAALDLDAADGILRNMALVQWEAGRREEALQTASRMKMADFRLLRLLRQA